MKIFTHPNLYQVVNVRNMLQLKRIETQLRNEFSAGAVGDLAPHDVWPELWLIDERDQALATQIIASLRDEALVEDWICSRCGEQNGGAFEECWQCGHTAPDDRN